MHHQIEHNTIQENQTINEPESNITIKHTHFQMPPKFSLCRHYLRGICPLPKEECIFAHGVCDIKFVEYSPEEEKEMKEVYLNFRKEHPFNQLNVVFPEDKKTYINIFEFHNTNYNSMISQKEKFLAKGESFQLSGKNFEKQEYHDKEKVNSEENSFYDSKGSQTQGIKHNESDFNKFYSLEDINKDKYLKRRIRQSLHWKEFDEFLELIEKHYCIKENGIHPGFDLEMLELLYYRMGFNKLMTRIKFNYLTEYLQNHYHGGFFKFSSVIPPMRKNTTLFLKLPSETQILSYYTQVYHELVLHHQLVSKPITEEHVRKKMITAVRDWRVIPPIMEFLKVKKTSLKIFVANFIMNREESKLEWATEDEILIIDILKLITEEIEKKDYCFVETDILGKNPKFSRVMVQKCIEMQRGCFSEEKWESEEKSGKCKLIIIKCPNIRTEIITREDYLKPECYHKKFGQSYESKLFFDLDVKEGSELTKKQNEEELKPELLCDYEIISIENKEELKGHEKNLLNLSGVIGVDIEGSLVDSNGYISLIQLNNYSLKIIYLIDYLAFTKNEETLICNEFIFSILSNHKLIKVIHDSRNDVESFYNLLFSHEQTKSMQKLHRTELKRFINIFDSAASEFVIRQIEQENVKMSTPGLNDILEKYGQLPNKLKEKYHEIWESEATDPAIERPMPQEFKEYCSMDVLGLPKMLISMCKRVNVYFLLFVSQLHADLSLKKEKKFEKKKEESK